MSKDFESTLDKTTMRVLRPVIQSARAELRDLDTEDVPAALAQVAKRSDRTLPPPVARSVIRELMKNDSLREAARVRLAEKGPIEPALVRFFDNPDDGLVYIAEQVLEDSGGAAIRELHHAQKRIATLEDELDVAKTRLSDERAKHVLALDKQHTTLLATHRRTRERNVDLRTRIGSLEQDLHDRDEQISELDIEVEMHRRRSENAVGRRGRGESGGSAGRVAGQAAWSRSNPLELARRLDMFERVIRPYRARSDTKNDVMAAAALSIPSGIAPDSSDALASLIAQSPRRFIIDGYNVSGELHGENFSTRDAREDVLRHAGSLARRTRGEVLVVFDGPASADRTSFRTESGVNVTFSGGTEADDVIESLVLENPERTVVITNDKLLRERCTVDGCIPVWATALLVYLAAGGYSGSG